MADVKTFKSYKFNGQIYWLSPDGENFIEMLGEEGSILASMKNQQKAYVLPGCAERRYTYANGLIVTVIRSNGVLKEKTFAYTLPCGETWTLSQIPNTTSPPTTVITSPDGKTWTMSDGSFTSSDGKTWAVSSGKSLILSDGTILTQSDDDEKTLITPDGKKWSMSDDGRICTSPDGKNWTVSAEFSDFFKPEAEEEELRQLRGVAQGIGQLRGDVPEDLPDEFFRWRRVALDYDSALMVLKSLDDNKTLYAFY